METAQLVVVLVVLDITAVLVVAMVATIAVGTQVAVVVAHRTQTVHYVQMLSTHKDTTMAQVM